MLSGLNTIGTEQGFKDTRYAFVKDVEGVKPGIYLDTVSVPTIGIGFNVRELDMSASYMS